MTNLADEIQALSGYGHVFPNVGSLGYYSSRSQAVTVRVADRSTYEAMRQGDKPVLSSWQFFSVCLHELTHWLDHVSTLWGQRNLVNVHNAFNAWLNQDEHEFWRVVQLEAEIRRGTLQSYYTVVDQPSAPRPWRQSLTYGMEFDAYGRLSSERPIAFLSFFTEDGRRICRTPLTIASLLEAAAVWAEYYALSGFLWSSESDEVLVERSMRQRELLDRLYEPELALYSAAVQLVAKSADSVNAYEAYELSAALSLLCLNLPDEAFDRLVVPGDIAARLGEREASFRKRRDLGFAFLILSKSAPRFEKGSSVEEWVRETAARSALPPLENLQEQVRLELEELPKMVIKGPVAERALALLQVGRQNYGVRGVFAERPLSLPDMTPDGSYLLPPVVLDDGAVVHTSYQQVRQPSLQPEESVKLETRYLYTSEEFRQACTP